MASLPASPIDIIELRSGGYKLLMTILERRRVIRTHRDQKLDNRCWLDDLFVWAMLSDSPPEPFKLGPPEQTMSLCQNFYVFRRASRRDPIPKNAIREERLWNKDLLSMSKTRLEEELSLIQQAIKAHRDIFGRHRTIDDDRLLYKILPEKLPADFRLPPRRDFLGDCKAPRVGCPSFIRSHQSCTAKVCDLHKWGPCS